MAVSNGVKKFLPPMSKLMYNLAGFNKVGLKYDDLLDDADIPEIKEALRRLPKPMQDERMYRCIRAIQLSMQKRILPQEEWTKYEEDERYLQPYLDEVIKEKLEKEEWDKRP